MTQVTAALAEQTPTSDFSTFGLPEKLTHALTRMNFTTPTPIQSQAIPLAMQGRDILGSAQTGTGKTGAFGIPLIAKLMENPQACALVMTPTRELAAQVLASLEQMIPMPNLKTALLIGGEPMPKQFNQLKIFPRLIVGTPGRINDHLTRGTLRLNRTEFLVLDETDRMLDMGFSVQLEKIAQYLPKQRQTMMFSATMPPAIVKLSANYLNNPERIAVGSTTNAAANIKQEMVQVNESEKYNVLMDQLEQCEGSVIIFVKTKFGTERLADKLCREEFRADAIHGDLQQRKRDRVIQGFRDKKYRILVATDVAARGLDIPHIEHVINYDLPQCPEDYIHRIGRTARAGAEGRAVSLLTPADKLKWKAIQRLMNPGAKSEEDDSDRGQSGQRNRRGGYQGGQRSEQRSGGGAKKPGGFFNSRKPAFGGSRDNERSFGGQSQGGNGQSSRSEGRRFEGSRSEGFRSEGQRSGGQRRFGNASGEQRGGQRSSQSQGGQKSFSRRSRDAA